MGLDLLALGILAAFAGLGAFRGARVTALGIGGFVAGYAAALLFGGACGAPLAAAIGAPPLLAAPIGGAAVFAGVSFATTLVSRGLVSRERARRAGAPRASGDLALGAAFGALRGGFVALLVGWLGLWLEALQGIQAPPGSPADAARAPGSRIEALAQEAVERGTSTVLGADATQGRVAAHLLARPAETFAGLRGLLESPRFTALREDARFWDALEGGDVATALGRGSFRSLAYDASVRGDLAALGLVDPARAGDPKEVEQALSQALRGVAPRLAGLHSDPELQALLADPEVRSALERGDHWSLLQNPGFQRLVSRLASGTPGPGA